MTCIGKANSTVIPSYSTQNMSFPNELVDCLGISIANVYNLVWVVEWHMCFFKESLTCPSQVFLLMSKVSATKC